MKETEEMKVSYEILVKEGAAVLSEDEKMVLRASFLGELYKDMLDSDIAMLLGEQILAKWRKRIEEGVREQNDYNDFVRANLPSNVPFLDTECALKIASKLICFEEVDVSNLKLPVKKTKAEKAREHSINIINNTWLLDPLPVPSKSQNGVSDESDGNWENGTAITLEGNEWRVLMTGGKETKINREELLDEKKFFI
jgi:hypothetical protein